MNKQEVIETLLDVSQKVFYSTGRRSMHINKIVKLVNQIDEPQKPVVPKGVMVKTLEQALKDESKKLKVPTSIRPYSVGYRIVSKNGNILALRNGASVFVLPSEAKKAIQREFGKNDPSFDVKKYTVEEVVIINFEKLNNFLQEVE